MRAGDVCIQHALVLQVWLMSVRRGRLWLALARRALVTRYVVRDVMAKET